MKSTHPRSAIGATTLSHLAAALALAMVNCAAAQAAPPPAPTPADVPAAAFFDPPAMSQPVMSPDGSAVAVLARNSRGHRELALISTADPTKINIPVTFSDADIYNVHWVNDKRLIFSSWDESQSADNQEGTGLFAVDRDGTDLRMLIRPTWNFVSKSSAIHQRALPPDHVFLRTLRDGSADILIRRMEHNEVAATGMRYHVEFTGSVPLRLDTRTGLTTPAVAGRLPDHAFEWVFDADGHALAAETSDAGVSTVLTPDGKGAWIERARFAAFFPVDGYELRQVGSDGQVYVTHAAAGDASGAAALYTLDLATGKPGAQPLVSLKGFDFDGEFVEDTAHHKLLGVHYTADAQGTVWFDPKLKAMQARLDERLPGLVNIVDPAPCACAPRVLVTSFSDHQPAVFFLYDPAADILTRLGQERPAIDARSMADTDFVRIPARDGQDIPAYVTKPHGKGPWPAVVLVHGGPQVRGWDWEWDGEAQFLASRGYLVVAPEYRGSAGYGETILRSGFKQWGLKSQDDIADATTWAAHAGLADPKRTCIAGASYGGYATLMGLVRYGDLYQCGVAWSAVADIDMMYDLWWSDMSNDWKGYGMPIMVGDRVKDAAQFAQTSPLKQAARITRPLLLAHGSVDQRVPVDQAYALRDALVAHHAPVTWIEYPEEAHGWYRPETRVDFYQRMANFLDANIGSRAAAR